MEKGGKTKKAKGMLNDIFNTNQYTDKTNEMVRFSQYLNKSLMRGRDPFITEKYQEWLQLKGAEQ